MESTKHAWQKPQLTVLVRSRPEEAVLSSCKGAGGIGPEKGKCKMLTGPNDCSATAIS